MTITTAQSGAIWHLYKVNLHIKSPCGTWYIRRHKWVPSSVLGTLVFSVQLLEPFLVKHRTADCKKCPSCPRVFKGMIGFKCLTPSCQSFGAENLTFRQCTGTSTEKRPTEYHMFCISEHETDRVCCFCFMDREVSFIKWKFPLHVHDNQTIVMTISIEKSEKMHLITLFEGICGARTHIAIKLCYKGLKCVFDTMHVAKHST